MNSIEQKTRVSFVELMSKNSISGVVVVAPAATSADCQAVLALGIPLHAGSGHGAVGAEGGGPVHLPQQGPVLWCDAGVPAQSHRESGGQSQ